MKCINIKTGFIRKFDICPDGWTDKDIPAGLLRPIWDTEKKQWVEGASVEEIEKYIESQKVRLLEEFMRRKKEDGEIFYNEVDEQVHQELLGQPSEIVRPAVECMNIYVRPLMDFIKTGDWYSALVDIETKLSRTTTDEETGKVVANPDVPTNDICRRVWDTVVQKTQWYVSTVYAEAIENGVIESASKTAARSIKKHVKSVSKKTKLPVEDVVKNSNTDIETKKSLWQRIIEWIKSIF